MQGKRYLEVMRQLANTIESEHMPTIEKAADEVSERLAAGGALHIYDTGHMLNQELVHRAGGLLAMTPLQFGLSVHNPVGPFHAARPGRPGPDLRLTDVALDASQVRAGDVLIAGSVSGRNEQVVDVAMKARERGAFVIALTAVAYSSQVTSKHPSGKRLYEVADLALDNCAVLGDASLEIDGLEVKAIPTSGIGAAMVAWTLIAEVIERLIAKGHTPQVFASANLDWGVEFNERARKAFEERGL